MPINFYDKARKHLGKAKSYTSSRNQAQIYKVNQAILEQSGGQLIITCNIPILDVHGYWSPNMFRPKMQLDWHISFSCAAHANFPYLCFFNQDQQNRGTIATTNLIDDSVITAKMNQQTGNYDIEIIVAVSDLTTEFDIIIDKSDRHWPDTMQDYRSSARPDWQPSYPESAWQPVYCTWYAVHAAIKQQWLDEHIDKAAKMGFGTFIVDDGWCFDDMKRVTPQTIGNWYEQIGDWQVSQKELPEFKAHVKRAQKLGLQYLLWVSPFMVGTKSKFYSEVNCTYLSDEYEGYRVFDPENSNASTKSLNLLTDIVNDYGLDGLKIDFVDAVPQSIDTPRGRSVYNYMTTLMTKIKENVPDALIEFRQRYATPIMLDLGTQFRAGDVPFDFIENLHRIAQIRICLGNQVPVHADPVYWHPEESAVNVARHMICSLAGVPMVSMDLNTLSAEHRNIIENWLSFYKNHIETFKNGHWQVRYNIDHIAYITVEYASDKIIFICDENLVSESAGTFEGTIQLLNLSNTEIPGAEHAVFDTCGQPVNSKVIPLAGHGVIVR